MRKILITITLTALIAFSCGSKDTNKDNKTTTTQDTKQQTTSEKQDTARQKTSDIKSSDIKIKSTAFTQEGMIPKKFACDGDNVSPQLSWDGAPAGTKSFALIMDDPDAPSGDHVHWVMYNIPVNTKELAEKTPKDKKLANGILQGMNGNKKTGYDGPCPPDGTHRYFFKLYALDCVLDLNGDVDKAVLLDAMKGHILAQGELMGKYSKQ